MKREIAKFDDGAILYEVDISCNVRFNHSNQSEKDDIIFSYSIEKNNQVVLHKINVHLPFEENINAIFTPIGKPTKTLAGNKLMSKECEASIVEYIKSMYTETMHRQSTRLTNTSENCFIFYK